MDYRAAVQSLNGYVVLTRRLHGVAVIERRAGVDRKRAVAEARRMCEKTDRGFLA
jgi:hypothetical protein